MRKYLLKTSEGLARRILETTEQTTGVICVALDLEVAGAAVAMSFRGKAPRYWRLHQWNRGWRGFQKFHHVLGPGVKAGAAARKKAIVACARLLAIDLWRIETGQITPKDVGLILAETSTSRPKAKPSFMTQG
jgi:hypothetical protein